MRRLTRLTEYHYFTPIFPSCPPRLTSLLLEIIAGNLIAGNTSNNGGGTGLGDCPAASLPTHLTSSNQLGRQKLHKRMYADKKIQFRPTEPTRHTSSVKRLEYFEHDNFRDKQIREYLEMIVLLVLIAGHD